MEQKLDTTFLRPGVFEKAAAVGLGAAGIGVGILLATWGVSFLWRYTPPEIAVRIANPEVSVKQDAPFEVTQNKPFELAQPEALKIDPAEITVKVDQTPYPALSKETAEKRTESGEVIRHEVTLFSSVNHGQGIITTGWNYKDGRGGKPISQFCYYSTADRGGASRRIDIANDGKRLSLAAAALVPNLDQALSKCRWWRG